MNRFLQRDQLEHSWVVANSKMNRERKLTGPNSYTHDLGVNPLDLLQERLRDSEPATWVDLCCGTGKALREAAMVTEREGSSSRIVIIGLDLAGFFVDVSQFGHVELHEATIESWSFPSTIQLITCVHGLHYVGDKLAAIQRAVSHLSKDGVFLAHVDIQNFKSESGSPIGRKVTRLLREVGIHYESRRHLLKCVGPCKFDIPFEYVGADDHAGPNYTGQDAVNSHYRI